MDTQRWHRLKDLFEHALAVPPAERPAYLRQACDDAALRDEVHGLLALHEADSDFMQAPVRDEALHLVAETDADRSGTQVGPYRLLRPIGQGGMGTVYLAERSDGQFEQRVAIKLVRHGPASAELLRRLRHERQILASLQHPSIARLLGGGLTDEGAPYLVMELVDGEPITTFCDRRGLSIPERLRLFRTVCDAVHHAHQNLVVHRDLKPSNILVQDADGDTGDRPAGRVKLLDFGIAKLLTEPAPDALTLTRTGVRPMTPEYASPEQVRGEPVTTAIDVYALGCVLFELLTGRRPLELDPRDRRAAERQICEEAPPRPSLVAPERHRRRLRGDLDTVVLTALRKEPARRYASAEQLGDDLRRHLHHLPVRARPDTLRYRASVFVRRHTTAVAAGLAAVAVLLAGLGAFAWQARMVAAERDRAEARLADVRALAGTLLFDIHDAVRDLPGATPTRQLLVAEALRYLNKLGPALDDADPAARRRLQREIATAYTRVGELQGDPHYPNLGDLSAAAGSYRQALARYTELWRDDTTDATARHELAVALGRLAVVESWGGDNARAIQHGRRAIALLEGLDATPTVLHDQARIRSELGWWLVWALRYEDALTELRRAQSVFERLSRAADGTVDLDLDRARVYAYQGDALAFSGDLEGALRLHHEATLPFLQEALARHPHNPRIQAAYAGGLGKAARLRRDLGRHAQALDDLRRARAVLEALSGADPEDHRLRLRVAGLHVAEGEALTLLGRHDAAIGSYTVALDLRRAAYAADSSHTEVAYTYASAHRYLCLAHQERGRLATALDHCRQSVEVMEPALAADPANMVGWGELVGFYVNTARVHGALARAAAATPGPDRSHARLGVDLYDRALVTLDTLRAQGRPDPLPPDSLAAERARLQALLR